VNRAHQQSLEHGGDTRQRRAAEKERRETGRRFLEVGEARRSTSTRASRSMPNSGLPFGLFAHRRAYSLRICLTTDFW